MSAQGSSWKEVVDRHTKSKGEGVWPTPIEGLELFRVEQPIERLPTIYPASVCCIVQGEKRAYLDGMTYIYNASSYLCATMALPMESEVIEATPQRPVLGLLLDLNTLLMTETLLSYEAIAPPHEETERRGELAVGLVVAALDERFGQAMGRLLALLDEPVALRVLGRGRISELLFAVLEGEAGPLIRQTFGQGQEITGVIDDLQANLAEPLSVDELARRAGMSRAVFYRKFKRITNRTPLQFIKAMRLSQAAMQIVGGRSVAEAALAVGYVSPSQFSREFRQRFGASPREWARAARHRA